ncbi:MAG: hypothetical protein QOI61_114 [Actinomycetota bacterium]|jgi:uncharacterized protein with FMN-binding domain
MSFVATGALTYGFALAGGGAAPSQLTSPAQVLASGAGEPQPFSVPASPAPAPSSVVNGAVYTNKYGEVQVQATFGPNGSLGAVGTLLAPSRDQKSVRINDQAVPRLNSEAVAAQSSRIDTVSGATYTSDDYRRSLQSAIDAARASGIARIA